MTWNDDRERTSIALYGNSAGTPGATVLERLVPREIAQRLSSGERGGKFDLPEATARFGDILNMEGPLVEIQSLSVFGISAVGGWQ
jgi:hypothetical protein